MGRRVDIDENMLRELARIHCTLEEIEQVLHVDRNTLSKPRWRKIIDAARAEGKASLRRRQYYRAEIDNSDTMLIWLGKQILEQRDGAGVDADAEPTRIVVEVVTRNAQGEGDNASEVRE